MPGVHQSRRLPGSPACPDPTIAIRAMGILFFVAVPRVYVNFEATMNPEFPPRPGPGCVDAPMWNTPSTGVS